MPKLDGIIITTSDGRPILHSHFRHPVTSYPLFHIDALNARIAQASSTAAGSSAAAQTQASALPLTTLAAVATDIEPLLWVPGVPSATAVAANGHDDDDEVEAGVLALDLTAPEGSLPGQEDVWRDSVTSEKLPSPAAHIREVSEALTTATYEQGILTEQGAALVHVDEGYLRFLCPVSSEVNPLLPLTFLRHVVMVLRQYLLSGTSTSTAATTIADTSGEKLTEELIRDNFPLVYQILEEMLDEGAPLTSEYNQLRDVVLAPTWLENVASKVGVPSLAAPSLASSQIAPFSSSVPWRRPAALSRYTNNEIYMDVNERLEGIVDRKGRAVMLELWASLDGKAKLSGTPDLLLTLSHPNLLLSPSFHPCVRLRRWQKERLLSFIPPDGPFTLASFRLSGAGGTQTSALTSDDWTDTTSLWEKHLPLQVKSVLDYPSVVHGPTSSLQSKATFSITLISRLSAAQAVTRLVISFHAGLGAHAFEGSVSGGLPTGSVSSASSSSSGRKDAAATTSQGTFFFDETEKTVKWEVPSLTANCTPLVLKGGWSVSHPHSPPSPALTTTFIVPTHSLCGLRVASLQLVSTGLAEVYTPFKGVRNTLRGDIEWRW